VDLKTMKAGILALCVCAAPQIATAQTMQWTDKGYASVTVGVQVGSHDLATASSFPLFDETATATTTQDSVGGGPFFEIGGAYRVWGHNLLAGISYQHTSSHSNAALTASIPDPVVTDSPRTVTQTLNDAGHSENVVHLDAIWMMPVAEKLDVAIFGGPSIFSVKQDTVTSFQTTEPGPVVNAPLTEVSKTTVGINLGVDVQYLLGKKWGVGGLARYAWGSADITGATDSLTVGGFQLGVGGRLRF
jgi:outer membrane protein with beta-barrel domain